ncbi:hypothetical protein MUO71_08005 [Candidatus Bathyarchaeota archaeon]|nr:hypothetical protein [Candidatus Bathyarchaeota archaeon]
MPVTINYQARDKLLKKYPKIEKCLNCNTCALVDPVIYAHDFSATKTFIHNVFSTSEPEKNPNIWLCMSCHKCEEICPYEVKPVEVIEGLKDEAFEKGCAPEFIREEINQVLTTGYAFPISQSLNYINRMRNNLGLEPLGERKVADLAIIARKTGLEIKLAGGKTK